MDHMKTAYAESETKRERQRQAKDAAERNQQAAELKAELKRRFLAMNGTTEEQFEDVFPTLLVDHFRREITK